MPPAALPLPAARLSPQRCTHHPWPSSQDKEGAAARAALLEAAVEAPEEEDPEFIMVTGATFCTSFCSQQGGLQFK